MFKPAIPGGASLAGGAVNAQAVMDKTIRDRIVFHDALELMEVDFSSLHFTSHSAIDDFYDEVDRQLSASGHRWYFLVNYAGCVIAPNVWTRFAARGKQSNIAFSLETARVGATEATRETILERAREERFLANLFESRDQALVALMTSRPRRDWEPRLGSGRVVSGQGLFERVLASLHAGVFDDARWPATSGLIDELCEVKGNALVFAAGTTRKDLEIYVSRFCYRGRRREEWEHRYFEVYHARDERIPRLRKLPDSLVVPVADLYTAFEKKTSPAYNEQLPRCHAQNGLNVRLDGPHGSRIICGFSDPADSDGWSSTQIETIERLLPHLRQYVVLRQALATARALGTSLMGLLDNTRSGVIQLDARGRIVAANDHARDMLRQVDALLDQGGFLHAASPSDDAELQRLLARALPPFGKQGVAGSMMVSGPSALRRLMLHVSPVDGRHLVSCPQGVSALVLVVDPVRRARLDSGSVAAILGLTPAESQMAVLLAEGWSVRDIAAATGRSEHTLRWHLKHVFAKLGVTRQAELMQLVVSLASLPQSRR